MSDIASIGELELIRRIARMAGGDHPQLLVGIGDDCAVLPWGDGQVLLVTTDMLVEGQHFCRDWCSPRQIGIRAAEANLSDIAAMGGEPRWAFCALALPPTFPADDLEQLHEGMLASFKQWGVALAGGDTCRGEALVLSLTLLGCAPETQVRRRCDARPGDLLGVTGTLGKAKAGLELLRAGAQGIGGDEHFLEPRCRLELVPVLAPQVRALIDVSDGLASEVRHICEASSVGAEVQQEQIPLSAATRGAARLLGQDPVEWALCGGEDFELLFSATPEAMDRIHATGADVTVVGRILPAEQGIWLVRHHERLPLGHGFDHFDE